MIKHKNKTKRACNTHEISARKRPERTFHKAFTLMELVVTGVVSVVVVLGIGFMMADNQRAWHRTYNKIYSDVVTDGFVARRAFDSIVRKASKSDYIFNEGEASIEFRYFQDPDASEPDRYAIFRRTGNNLELVEGNVGSEADQSIRTICANVSECMFKAEGKSAQMILTLDNGSDSVTTVACGYMHN